MGTKDVVSPREASGSSLALFGHRGLIREIGHLDDLDHDFHTEISDIEAAERTSRYIDLEMSPGIIAMR